MRQSVCWPKLSVGVFSSVGASCTGSSGEGKKNTEGVKLTSLFENKTIHSRFTLHAAKTFELLFKLAKMCFYSTITAVRCSDFFFVLFLFVLLLLPELMTHLPVALLRF